MLNIGCNVTRFEIVNALFVVCCLTAAVPKLNFIFTKKLTQFDNAMALSNQYLQFPFYRL